LSLRGLVLLATAVFAGLLPATAAHAAPTVDEIEKQIDTQWEQLEPVIEQYNKVHTQLAANQKKAAELEKKIQPLSLQADLAMTRIGSIASRYYMTGPGSDLNALLASGSTTTFVDQLTILDRLAAQENAQVADVVEARDKYTSEKEKLDSLIAQQKQQDTELAARKKTIDGEIDRLQKLRETAYGSSSSGGALRIGPCPAEYIGGAAGTAVKTACAQIGKPYVWGADGPGSFDCSGLTQFAWGKAGVGLAHHAATQWKQGAVVSRANARPGDLVFFYGDLHHVGMYVGKGLMVHAPRAGKPVQMARIDEMPVVGFRRPS
jgi:cell wall-associated NlpC family hydrolase